ncbi:MAG: glycosyltransferase family 2 protein [Fidelibacterota bacterium]
MTIHVHILILNWNGKALTADCLTSFKNQTYLNYSLYVIDNGSTDGSVDFLKKQFSHVQFIVLPENLGFAAGNNRGFDQISERLDPSDFILFLNNDTIVEPDFLEELLIGVENFGVHNIYSPKILYADHRNKIWYAGGHVDLNRADIRHIGIREPDGGIFLKNTKTGFVSGCSLLLRVGLFKKLNGFDESFGMYSEDVDLCLRAIDLGSECYMIPKSKIYHKVSASVGGNWSLRKNLKKLQSILRIIRLHKGYIRMLLSIVFLVYQIPRQYFNLKKMTK